MIIVRYKYLTKTKKSLNYYRGKMSMKHQFIIYADLECLLKKMSTCCKNPKKSSATKGNKHNFSGCSLFT